MTAPEIQLQDLLVIDDPHDMTPGSQARLRAATWTATSEHGSLEPSNVSDPDDSSQRPLTTDQHAGHNDHFSPPSLHVDGVNEVISAASDDRDSQLSHAADVLEMGHFFKRWSTYLRVVRWWIPELVASALSLASFAFIVILLIIYDRYAATRLHLPTGLTLNGILALLATVGRVCLCTPVCSGLLQEMWLYLASESRKPTPKSRLRDLGLFVRASYGTLGSLEFLTHPSGAKFVASLGCLIMILSLVFGTFVQQLVAYEFTAARNAGEILNIPRIEQWSGLHYQENLLVGPLEAAFYESFFSNNTTPLSPSCPSGECSWPITPSLAVCGECKQQSYRFVGCFDTRKHLCNYTLESGQSVTLQNASVTTWWLDHNPGPQFISAEFQSSVLDQRLNFFRADLIGLQNWDATRVFDDTFSSGPIYNQCVLSICVQYYNTSVRSGQHYQQVVEADDEGNSLWDNNGTLWRTVGRGSQYAISSGVLLYLESLVRSLYGTIGSGDETMDKSGFLYWLRLQNAADADAWVKNAAARLTNVIRANSSSWQRDEYNGIQNELAVVVRWEWVALPAALVLSSLIFLITVIVRTAESPFQSWKGSPLTLLLFELDMAIRDVAIERLHQYGGVEEAVGRQKVRLVQTVHRRWRLDAA